MSTPPSFPPVPAPGLPPEIAELVRRVGGGDRKAAARAISMIEDECPEAHALLEGLYPLTGRAYRVGITGPPGVGKSTLIAALTCALRAAAQTVGIVAVDPTSPFTGGALLGDRVRMSRVATDPEVFIRSMASRGSLGGLARTTSEACDVLDAMGKDTILIETVGVGQSEIEIADEADTTLVVLSPEAGDGVQTMKAGLMEIGNVFVVNKADREGADRMVRTIETMLELAAAAGSSGAGAGGTPHGEGAWQPPVLKMIAQSGEGVPALVEALDRHRRHLRTWGLLDSKRRERIERKIRLLVEEKLWALFFKGAAYDRELARLSGEVLAGRATPYSAANDLLNEVRSRGSI